MVRIFRLFAASVLMLSVLAHLCTFVPSPTVSLSRVWPLHPGAMVAFGAMVVIESKGRRKRRKAQGGGFGLFRFFNDYSRQWRCVPPAVLALCAAAFAYAAFNFVSAIPHLENGSLERQGSHYYLVQTDSQTRAVTQQTELSPGEYRRREALQVRLFSGHWILFSLLPVVFFTYVVPRIGSAGLPIGDSAG